MKEFSNHFDMLTEIERLEKQVEILKEACEYIAANHITENKLRGRFPDFSDEQYTTIKNDTMAARKALEKIREIK